MPTTPSRSIHVSSRSSQTSLALTTKTPRKEKLRKNLKGVRNQYYKEKQKSERDKDRDLDLDKISFAQYKQLTLKFCPSLELASCINAVLSQVNKKPRGRRFSDEFKNHCLSLYFLGPKLYRKELVQKIGLPSVRTLQRFIQHIKIPTGVNDVVFQTLQKKASNFRNVDKLCIICVDEMSIKANLFYATDMDRIIGFEDFGNEERKFKPALNATVVMARGLSANWKQPLCYFFVNSTCPGKKLKELICDVISRLTKIDLKVTAVVSDMGSNNIQLAQILGVTPECPYFHHEHEKIVYLFDTPHLLKSLRNNFLKHRFEIDGHVASWEFIEKFFNHDQRYPIRAAPKLTTSHIQPNSFEKMKVKYASQIFSNTVAAGLNVYIRFGELPQEACTTQQFVGKINNLFDVLNSSNLFGATKFQNAYKGTEDQNYFLQECLQLFDNLIVRDWKGDNVTKGIKCIRGWKITINGTMHLWDVLKNKGMEFLFTRRVQQDCLENFFGTIRQQNGNCINPTAIQFIRTFRKLFCMKIINSGTENCEEDAAKIVIKVADISNVEHDGYDETERVIENDIESSIDKDYKTCDLLQKNFFRYISGYLISKCMRKHTCPVCHNYAKECDELEDTSLYSYLRAYHHTDANLFGGLLMPSNNFVYLVSYMEAIFQENFERLSTRENVVGEFVRLFENGNFSHPCPLFPLSYVIRLYARIRIYYTLKDIQKNFKQTNRNRKLIIWKHS